MSAGTGILHSEKDGSWRLQGAEHRDPAHFVQMGVVPDEGGVASGYEQLEIDDALLTWGSSRWRPEWPSTTVLPGIGIRNR